MKNLSKTIPVLFITFLATTVGCQKEPTASFSASKTNVEVGESVKFTNTSEDGESFEWEFGDGSSSSSENPSYSYSNAGTYTVSLTAFSKNGKKSDNATTTITVNAVDPCKDVTCLNGGNCVDGTCVCAEGYSGVNCSQQVTPTKVIISKITVTEFPATDNGAGWDVTSGPDIYVDVDQDPNTIWSSPIYYQNANPSSVYDFDPQPFIEITNVTSQVSIRLYDYDDFDADDFMGGIIFSPYTSTGGFPTELNLDAGGGVAFTISLDYVW